MSTVAAAVADELPLKEWAKLIAAQAPPPSDDRFMQVHHAFLGGAPRYQAPELSQAA